MSLSSFTNTFYKNAASPQPFHPSLPPEAGHLYQGTEELFSPRPIKQTQDTEFLRQSVA